jgi:hypothetical protein
MAVYCFYSGVPIGGLAATLRKLADTGLAASTSLLGFLIAGFTVFATVTKVELFVEMARVEHEQSGESYLKYNLSAFVVVFVHYVAYLFVCMTIVVLGQSGGPVSFVVKTLAIHAPQAVGPELILAICGILLVLLATWTFYLILLLKSFVYNTYQVLVTVVRWDMEAERSSPVSPPSEYGKLPSEATPSRGTLDKVLGQEGS